jgi:hypothetical protein
MTDLLFVRGKRRKRRMFPVDNGGNDARGRRLIGITLNRAFTELRGKITDEVKEVRHAQRSAT